MLRSALLSVVLLVLFQGGCQSLAAGTAAESTVSFGFWNVENLFDCEDDPDNPGDDEFLPDGEWTPERYARKLDHLAEVVAALDADLLALAEVENRRVLEDLLAHEKLAGLGYRIVHRDSPDKRGIDLALFYRAPFEVADGERAVILHPIDIPSPTRGILEVNLRAPGHPLTVLVNHWPSRYGGREKTIPLRHAAAELCRRIVLARQDASPEMDADILILGDLNDDPFDASVRHTLKAVRSRNAALNNRNERYLYNPSWRIFGTPDQGTLYYNREWVWNVFDQCIVSRGLLKEEGLSFVD